MPHQSRDELLLDVSKMLRRRDQCVWQWMWTRASPQPLDEPCSAIPLGDSSAMPPRPSMSQVSLWAREPSLAGQMAVRYGLVTPMIDLALDLACEPPPTCTHSPRSGILPVR